MLFLLTHQVEICEYISVMEYRKCVTVYTVPEGMLSSDSDVDHWIIFRKSPDSILNTQLDLESLY